MKPDPWADALWIGLGALLALGVLAFLGTEAYVAWHFITKYW
jgi:hypothetical protein